mmetsp:Transcript_31934/g.77819  ORF Transcript_31934/g.77819 Transcript_31934/m.77819 type:complete len:516 (+) Transcript_31934:280-1827(+)
MPISQITKKNIRQGFNNILNLISNIVGTKTSLNIMAKNRFKIQYFYEISSLINTLSLFLPILSIFSPIILVRNIIDENNFILSLILGFSLGSKIKIEDSFCQIEEHSNYKIKNIFHLLLRILKKISLTLKNATLTKLVLIYHRILSDSNSDKFSLLFVSKLLKLIITTKSSQSNRDVCQFFHCITIHGNYFKHPKIVRGKMIKIDKLLTCTSNYILDNPTIRIYNTNSFDVFQEYNKSKKVKSHEINKYNLLQLVSSFLQNLCNRKNKTKILHIFKNHPIHNNIHDIIFRFIIKTKNTQFLILEESTINLITADLIKKRLSSNISKFIYFHQYKCKKLVVFKYCKWTYVRIVSHSFYNYFTIIKININNYNHHDTNHTFLREINYGILLLKYPFFINQAYGFELYTSIILRKLSLKYDKSWIERGILDTIGKYLDIFLKMIIMIRNFSNQHHVVYCKLLFKTFSKNMIYNFVHISKESIINSIKLCNFKLAVHKLMMIVFAREVTHFIIKLDITI